MRTVVGAAIGAILLSTMSVSTAIADQNACGNLQTKQACESQAACRWIEPSGKKPHCVRKSKVLWDGGG